MALVSSSPLLFFLILHTVIRLTTANLDISCKTVRSQVSATSNGATISAKCDTNHPTLVSCGFSTKEASQHPQVELFEGSFIENNRCYARNANGGSGVYAWARCCNFQQTVSCSASNGKAADNDDDLSTLHCPSNKYMLGCTAHTTGAYFDGCFPGSAYPSEITHFGPANPFDATKTCNGRNGGSSNTQSNINCCTASIGFECNVYYAAAGKNNELECPSHQTMISCMGTEPHMAVNAWYIQRNSDSNPHACTTRGWSNAYGVYTAAICCNEKTQSPTRAPSDDPTNVPTASPTSDPSTSPTEPSAAPTVPTIEPTEVPTHTRAPTTEPTVSTKAPSTFPTVEPTVSTNEPSETPTAAPSAPPSPETNEPSSFPSVEPSSAPTESSADPSEDPTEDPSVAETPFPSVEPSSAPTQYCEGEGDRREIENGCQCLDNCAGQMCVNGASIGIRDSEGGDVCPASLICCCGGGCTLGELSGDKKKKNKETLYLVLFVVFGTLFCCLLAGVFYYFYYKNRKQGNEVKYENAAAAMHYNAAGKSVDASEAYKQMGDVDAAVLHGINAIGTEEVEGLATNATGTVTTSGGTINTNNATTTTLDASVGIKTSDGTQTGDGAVNSTASVSDAGSYAAVSAVSPGASGMRDEDEEKATVFSVQM